MAHIPEDGSPGHALRMDVTDAENAPARSRLRTVADIATLLNIPLDQAAKLAILASALNVEWHRGYSWRVEQERGAAVEAHAAGVAEGREAAARAVERYDLDGVQGAGRAILAEAARFVRNGGQ